MTAHNVYNELKVSDRKLRSIVELIEPPLVQPSDGNNTSEHKRILIDVPIGVKDMVAIEGVVRGNGNPNCKERGLPEPQNASVIDKILKSGAQIVATTTLLEYAAGAQHQDVPETRNPQDPTLTAGGSSAGSAALVGDGALPLAIGTDTGGSIRIPAAYCGCYGIKPTYNAINLDGVTPLAPSLDHLGFLGESLEIIDRALVATIPNYESLSESNNVERKLNIGIPRNWVNDSRNDENISKRFAQLENELQSAGHYLSDIDTVLFEETRKNFVSIVLYEAWQVHKEMMQSEPEFFGNDTRRLLQSASEISLAEYEGALQDRELLRPQIDALLSDLDLLLMPAVPYFAPTTTPPLDSELGGYEGLYSEVFNATGHPALVSPCNCTPMKMGVQLVGKINADNQLIADARIIDAFLKE